MGIKSSSFSSVSLTGKDARKFENQITYGKPKKQAIDAAKRAKGLAESFSANGVLSGRVRETTQ